MPPRVATTQIIGAFRVIGTVGQEATLLNEANGRIAYRFHARDLHVVMRPAARGTSPRFRVLIDGQPPGAAHGIDVDEDSAQLLELGTVEGGLPSLDLHRLGLGSIVIARDRVPVPPYEHVGHECHRAEKAGDDDPAPTGGEAVHQDGSKRHARPNATARRGTREHRRSNTLPGPL
jgi:Thioredoxin like C-terminal domain